MIEEKLLRNEEKAVFALRALYRKHGYLPFCMSKFEEYDLYVQNKDFLVGDSVITFNDTDGRLLALKPDVTLSIIKNTADEVGCCQRVFYNENVYRVSAKTHRYKEIMQTGLECIGDTDIFDVFEVLSLALESLATVSESFVLDISHMGVFSALLDSVTDSEAFKRRFTKLVSEKNRHEAEALFSEYSVPAPKRELLFTLIDTYGSLGDVLAVLKPLCMGTEAESSFLELSKISELLSGTGYADKVRFDFSVVNDMNYYSGIVFRGFLPGVYEGVLAGGEYGALMRRMGRKSSAIGFALYLDLLDELDSGHSEYDVDVLLLYGENTDPVALTEKKRALIDMGKSVSLQREVPGKLRYRELVDLK